jgi:site-specific recombinase XerD
VVSFAGVDTFLADNLISWNLYLQACRRTRGTIKIYSQAVVMFINWCESNKITPALTKVNVQKWLVHLLDSGIAPSTTQLRQTILRGYSKWLLSEREIATDELAGMEMVQCDTKVTPALADGQISAMVAACKGGKLLLDRRDEAIIRFMAETGARASEVTDLKITDVNLSVQVATITRGKGGKGRIVPFSGDCAAALDRYIRVRRKELAKPETGPLWIGDKGGTFGYAGMRKTLLRRARLAGISNFHPHLFRHTAATRWLRHGGSEAGLMAVAGWSTRSMIDRYTAASASERAVEESRRLNLGF